MCVSHIQDEPLTLPGTVGPYGPLGNPSDDMGAPSIGPSDLTGGGPRTTNVPVRTPTTMGHILSLASGGLYDPTEGMGGPSPTGRMTKWGALSKILQPAMQGAAIGGFLGRSTPEGGFGAANQFFINQRLRNMQMQQFFLNAMKMQSEVGKNQAETGFYNRGGGTRIGQPVIGDNGNYWQTDPVTRELVDTGVKAKAPKETPDQFEWNTDEQGNKTGMLVDRANATARTVTIKGVPRTPPPGIGNSGQPLANAAAAGIGNGTAESASEPSARATGTKIPTQFDSGSPRVLGSASQSPAAINAMAVSGGAPSSDVPRNLTQSVSTAPKPTVRTIRDAKGVERDVVIDENPRSKSFGKTIQQTGVTRQPAPDRVEARKAETSGIDAQIETYASEALNRNENDPDKAIRFMNGLQVGDKDAQTKLQSMLPKIRQHIRDRMKQGKKRLTLSPADAKAAGLTPTTGSSVTDEDEENP